MLKHDEIVIELMHLAWLNEHLFPDSSFVDNLREVIYNLESLSTQTDQPTLWRYGVMLEMKGWEKNSEGFLIAASVIYELLEKESKPDWIAASDLKVMNGIV